MMLYQELFCAQTHRWKKTGLSRALLCLAPLVMLCQPLRAEHVFYISQGDGHVRELYYNGAWQGNDLTADTNGPAAADNAGLSSFSAGIEHVFYISQDSHVRELYYNYNGAWQAYDLTASSKGPAAAHNSGLTSFYDYYDGSERVFYISFDYHVHELYYSGLWQDIDLTASTHGPAAGPGGLTSYFDRKNTLYVFYTGKADGHVRDLYLNGGTWQGTDLTASTKGPAAYPGGLTSFVSCQTTEHVFYISASDYHVRELYQNGAWEGNDLTADTNGPLAYAPVLSSFMDTIHNIEHVFYISGGDNHVREMYWNGVWQGTDLTADANGPSPNASPLTGFLDDNDNMEHVFYISEDGHVRELYWNGVWQGNDLTADTGGPLAQFWNSITSFL